MRDENLQYLIDVYERKKGRKGSFMHLLAYFKTDIIDMVGNGYSILMIVEKIQKELIYEFQSEKNNNPFYKAVYSFVKNLKDEPPKIKLPIIAQPSIELYRTENKEEVATKIDKSHLVSKSTVEKELDKVFDQDAES